MLLMKEIKIVGTFCTGVVLVILSMYYMSRNSTISGQVFLDNIEALSGGENGGEIVKCYCKTHWFSPNVCSVNADGGYCGGNPCANHDGNCR